ncbi:hypothetical protein [Sphingobium sp.]|uniref:hypothetical protein n=1 Tax=Sphingobium sp. TaxID=1912891 RepID=UPI0035C6E7BE
MLAILLAAASTTFTTPSEPLKGQLQSAIWADLQLNAMIGNGNWLASLWYQAGNDTAPDLHIQELRCGKTRTGHQCAFDLYRDGGIKVVLNKAVPDRLACVASFALLRDGLSVFHTSPRGSGHSKTSMRCETIER